MTWPNKVFLLLCWYLIYSDRTSCVQALGQVPAPVVLPSQLASAPAAATPASVCFLTPPWHNHWEYSAVGNYFSPLFLNLFGFVLRLSKYVTLSLRPLVRARNLCPCGRRFESCFLPSWTFRHRAICNQAGSQEAHTGAHMAGLRSPAQPPPTRSHARAPHAKRGKKLLRSESVSFTYPQSWQETPTSPSPLFASFSIIRQQFAV